MVSVCAYTIYAGLYRALGGLRVLEVYRRKLLRGFDVYKF